MDAIVALLKNPTVERVVASLVLIVLGGLLGWVGHRWRHYRLQRQVEEGDARDVATIEKVLIDRDADGVDTLRIRTCGRDPLDRIFPNPAALEAFQNRAAATISGQPLVGMHERMGSYLLQELAIWVCSQVGERDFSHDIWVMAVVCEPASFGGHQSSTVLLIRRDDLDRFRDWPACRAIHVEHGGHGERILTLMAVAAEHDRQAVAVARRQSEGRHPNYEETMYVLDLALDQRVVDLPSKPVPWTRFAAGLKARDLS